MIPLYLCPQDCQEKCEILEFTNCIAPKGNGLGLNRSIDAPASDPSPAHFPAPTPVPAPAHDYRT